MVLNPPSIAQRRLHQPHCWSWPHPCLCPWYWTHTMIPSPVLTPRADPGPQPVLFLQPMVLNWSSCDPVHGPEITLTTTPAPYTLNVGRGFVLSLLHLAVLWVRYRPSRMSPNDPTKTSEAVIESGWSHVSECQQCGTSVWLCYAWDLRLGRDSSWPTVASHRSLV